jgi:hypothetical protein
MCPSANADLRSIWEAWLRPRRPDPAPAAPCPANENARPTPANNDNSPAAFDGTLAGLIEAYRTDPVSPYTKVRFRTREGYNTLCRRLVADHGHERISDIKFRTLLAWHSAWSADGHTAMAHALVAMLRTAIRFGTTILEDPECARVSAVLHGTRFPMARACTQRLTADQATAIRATAHVMGKPSIALAQAFQFEAMLRQRDVIGEWLPIGEPGETDLVDGGRKWLRGIRWSEIDDRLVLTHTTSKRLKEITVDLKLAPMVIEELHRRFPGFLQIVNRDGKDELVINRHMLPASGPIIVAESTALPWTAHEFRRQWRKIANDAGVPRDVRNMDTRAGAISEATDAGADLEHVRHAATHSDIAMTQRYSRGSQEKVAKVQQKRLAHRSQNAS